MLTFPERKRIRARVIADYVRTAGYPGVIVFTCGHAAKCLRNEGLDVVEVSPVGALQPGKWWKPAEIHRVWPHLFDATSGHLPAPLMMSIARAFRDHLGDLTDKYYQVPTGSGETIICLRIAYPDIVFEPIYEVGIGTEYEQDAPLNDWVSGKLDKLDN